MDIKVICTDVNFYFMNGMSVIIEEALFCKEKVTFLDKINSESISQADFIIINTAHRRLYMCHPAYRYRKKDSVLILFTEDTGTISYEKLPVCYQSLNLISRTETVKSVRYKIAKAWLLAKRLNNPCYKPIDCTRCKLPRISLTQMRVLHHLKRGDTVYQTARYLGMSVKTVYSHKYNIMRMFDLKGDFHFFSFLNQVSLFELSTGSLNDE